MLKNMNKEHKVLLILILVLSIGIGYAFLNTKLKINGTANIYDGRWNVHFENYQETSNTTVSPSNVSTPIIIEDSTAEISYTVNFNEPGDVYEFTIDIVNGGTLNAIVKSFETTIMVGNEVVSTIPDYLEYSLTNVDGTPYTTPHDLSTESSKTLLIRVVYKRDITEEQYAESKQKSLHFNVKAVCEQGENTQIVYVYTKSTLTYNVGQRLPLEAVVTTDYSNFTGYVFLRHKMVNGKIESTDIGYLFGDVHFFPAYEIGNLEQFRKTAELIKAMYYEDRCNFIDDGETLECQDFYTERDFVANYQNDLVFEDGELSCSVNSVSSRCYLNS